MLTAELHTKATQRKRTVRVTKARIRCNSNFDFAAKRRREIVLHARHVGAAETEDFSRWLIAWVWHNRKATDPVWSVMECAKRMGGNISEAEASAVIEEAAITRKRWTADNLARFLGVTFAERQALQLTTIGSVNVKKPIRERLRRIRGNRARQLKRRASGVRPRAEWEASSITSLKDWEKLGMSKRTWYRKGKPLPPQPPNGTGVASPIFLSTDATPVPAAVAAATGTPAAGVAVRRTIPNKPASADVAAGEVLAGRDEWELAYLDNDDGGVWQVVEMTTMADDTRWERSW